MEKTLATRFETPDQRQLMHLGHPEYNVGRILGEMERDRARGDVPPRRTSMPTNPRPPGVPIATCCSSSGLVLLSAGELDRLNFSPLAGTAQVLTCG
ncbi:MAG: hypothetical protein CM15mP77_0520 [Synechococcus sp.]|nr:MAG: hypothetical protein CM15mP77_0520 [Synechococcus sp.]